MKVYVAMINGPRGNAVLGIFSTSRKAASYINSIKADYPDHLYDKWIETEVVGD